MKRLVNLRVLAVLLVVLFLVPVTSFAASVTINRLEPAFEFGFDVVQTITLTPGEGLTALSTVPTGYTSGFSFAAGTYAGFTITATGGLTPVPAFLMNDTNFIDTMTLTGLAITPLAANAGDRLQIVYDNTFSNGLNGSKLYSARAAGTVLGPYVGGSATGNIVSLGTAGCFADSCESQTTGTGSAVFTTINPVVGATNTFSQSLSPNVTQVCNFGGGFCAETLQQTFAYTFEGTETLRMPGSLSAIAAYDGDGQGAARIAGFITQLESHENVPEPDSLLLLGVGLLFWGWVERKRLFAR